MESFEYNANPARQIFAAENIRDIIGDDGIEIFAEATMHTPREITEKAIAFSQTRETDCIISIGGGSTIGLGKAVSIRTGLYHIAVATTYAGSEVTPILGETSDGLKVTRSDPRILPGTVIYDVDLTLSLPPGLTSTSGVNAIAHAVEALYARNGNPIINLLAKEGIRALSLALPDLTKDPQSPNARSSALYGGSFNLPHSETHTIILPHALAYNAPKVPQAMAMLAEALPESDGNAVRGLNALLSKLNVPRALKDLGMKESDIQKAADIASSSSYWNPRELESDLIRELIRRAWAGEDARADL
ncbi:putative maleylacetate reductase protein [Eutypa lata UCREL1]|uniref:Putative maleylacetate reductase protein n=1 Tax=Eutypa lata (strain UCR-EL1) TaxID=1287681 RepID=M7SL64_EUTLA|nr:putative maleylacetate reductase protein [Eutypa lata UCREL1]